MIEINDTDSIKELLINLKYDNSYEIIKYYQVKTFHNKQIKSALYIVYKHKGIETRVMVIQPDGFSRPWIQLKDWFEVRGFKYLMYPERSVEDWLNKTK